MKLEIVFLEARAFFFFAAAAGDSVVLLLTQVLVFCWFFACACAKTFLHRHRCKVAV
jgi:hypothetical protein